MFFKALRRLSNCFANQLVVSFLVIAITSRMNTSYARKLSQAAGSFLAAVERERVWMAFIAALIVMVLAYRIELGIVIYHPHVSQVGRLQPGAVPFSGFLKTPTSDFLFIGLVGFCHLGLKLWLSWRFPNLAAATLFKITEGVVVIAVLLLLAVIERAHYELLLQLDTGLTLNFVRMAPDMFGVDDFVGLLILPDILFYPGAIAGLFAGTGVDGWIKADWRTCHRRLAGCDFHCAMGVITRKYPGKSA